VHLVDTLQDTEAGLVAQAQSGKLEAFEELARHHGQLIYRTLTAILGNPADAQDAMQDTLLSVSSTSTVPRSLEVFDLAGEYRQEYGVSTITTRKTFESLDEAVCNEERDFRPRQVRAWQDNPEELYSKSE